MVALYATTAAAVEDGVPSPDSVEPCALNPHQDWNRSASGIAPIKDEWGRKARLFK
ncbi:MAG: hypothetical protein OXH52_13950 [Gammaproteobacteria bacterium]|nr:hypothetical protein [Gammaproteobacteria bacterium]